jgi:C4-dicarboxylate-binding protein DctP
MKTLLQVVAAAVSATFLSCGTVHAESPIVIKFSHVVSNDTPKGQGAVKFKELAEKYTQGRVRVDVFANSSLYKDNEEMEALQLGAVQILAPSASKFGPMGITEFEAFDLPYLFRNLNEVHKVMAGPIGAELNERLKTKGIMRLANWDNGFKLMSANRPLRLPDDMRGLKVRIKSPKVLDAQMRQLGALPQVMAFSEVYQAMETGVVDGAENTPANMLTQKFDEVQKYTTITDHGFDDYVVITNVKFWTGLPPDVRAALEKAMAEATDFVNERARRIDEEAIAQMKKSGKTTFIDLTPAQREAWERALLPVRAAVRQRIGGEFLDRLDAAVKAARAPS